MSTDTTHITGQGTAATGYAVRIHRAGRDASRRAEQLRGLTADQITVIARRLKGLGGARKPKLSSEQVWAALDLLEGRCDLTCEPHLSESEVRARVLAAELITAGRRSLQAA